MFQELLIYITITGLVIFPSLTMLGKYVNKETQQIQTYQNIGNILETQNNSILLKYNFKNAFNNNSVVFFENESLNKIQNIQDVIDKIDQRVNNGFIFYMKNVGGNMTFYLIENIENNQVGNHITFSVYDKIDGEFIEQNLKRDILFYKLDDNDKGKIIISIDDKLIPLFFNGIDKNNI